jgi:hypothetical protein
LHNFNWWERCNRNFNNWEWDWERVQDINIRGFKTKIWQKIGLSSRNWGGSLASPGHNVAPPLVRRDLKIITLDLSIIQVSWTVTNNLFYSKSSRLSTNNSKSRLMKVGNGEMTPHIFYLLSSIILKVRVATLMPLPITLLAYVIAYVIHWIGL